MKKNLFPLSAMFGAIAMLAACSPMNHLPLGREAKVRTPKENSAACFVQKADGTIQHFKSLQLVTGIFTGPYLLADGKIKISGATIEAYQNEDHYAVSENKLAHARKSKVATEALPGFAVRITRGSLNIYCKKYFNGTRAVDELYVQVGDKGKIEPYSAALIAELVKNRPAAVDFLKSKKKPASISKRLQAVADIYNHGEMISKN